MKKPMKKSMLRLFAGMAVLCLWGLLFVIPAQAADKYWDAGDGDWNVGANWDPAGVPAHGDKVYLTSTDAVSRTVGYYNTDTNMYLNTLWIDATGAGATMTLNLSGSTDSKLLPGSRYIGYDGTGVVTQASGSMGGTLYLGYNSYSSGTYNLNGGTTGGSQSIGRYGTGVFNHNSGTNNIGEYVSLGYFSGSHGTYNLIDGVVFGGGGDEKIGVHGTGVFSQSGGSHTANTDLMLGYFSDGDGTYNLSGGSLESGFTTIGSEGTGEFNQSGGTHESTAGIYLATYAGSSGTYNLSGGSLEVEYGEVVGYAGTGTFTQTGGTHTVGTSLQLGDTEYGGGTGTYNLTGAEVSAETVDVTGNGQMHLSGGTVSAGSGGMINAGYVTFAGAPNTVNGDVVNHGTIKATDTTVTFTGTYTENGIYTSDPSINNFNNWIIGTSGVVGGGLGDIFNVSGDFLNHSLMNLSWNTDQAALNLNGGVQYMGLAGAEMGALFSGYDNNFAWGGFSLDSGVNLYINDGNAADGAALYVGLVSFADDLMEQLARIFSDYNIYYNAELMGNMWLGGLTYDLAGAGQLIAIGEAPVPIPGAVWLLGAGLIGLLGLRRKFRK